MLGYLPQEFGLYPTLTAWQMLDYFAKLKGIVNRKERHTLIHALLERVNLSAERSRRLGEFSGGMQQRLGIAQALIGGPQLIIVDEPTAGLDPEERNRFHDLISEAASDDTIVILSTHIVSDVSNLCSRMAIIRHGKILSACSPRDAVEQLKGSVWEGNVAREQLAAFRSDFNVISSRSFDGQTRVRVISDGRRPPGQFMESAPILEDYYFDLVNRVDA